MTNHAVHEPSQRVSVGGTAPAISLPSTVGRTLDLERYRAKVPVAVVFVGDHENPLDVLGALDREQVHFGERRVQVMAVAPMSFGAARRLSDEASFTLPILADEDGAVHDAYGAWSGPTGVMSVIVDPSGVVAEVILDPDAGDGHPGLVIERLDSLLGPGRADFDGEWRASTHGAPMSHEHVDLAEWDPMPDELRALDDVDHSDLVDDPMDGGAPTG